MSKPIENQFKDAHQTLGTIKAEIARSVYGQNRVIDQTLCTLLSGGHALLVGVPGVAKTLLVETIGTILGLKTNRIQCTPDLMPSDILGSEVLEQDESGKRSFRLIKGPIFHELLIADEINRAGPRTQSALLQAMQEYNVTIAGKTHALPAPFHVLATQNPLEQEGTYPLPEAQRDRFFMQIDVGYPDPETERAVVIDTTMKASTTPKKVIGKKDLSAMQDLVRQMPVSEEVVDGIMRGIWHMRSMNDALAWPPGPRAAQALILAIRAKALLDGRFAPSLDDVQDLAVPCLQHRMSLHYQSAASGATSADIIHDAYKDI